MKEIINAISKCGILYLYEILASVIIFLIFIIICDRFVKWYIVADFGNKELRVLGFLWGKEISEGPIFYMEHIRAIVRTATKNKTKSGYWIISSKNVVITKKYKMYDLTNSVTCKSICNEEAICRVLSECVKLEYIHCGQYDYVEIEENEIYQRRIVVNSCPPEICKVI